MATKEKEKPKERWEKDGWKTLPKWLQELWELKPALAKKAEKHVMELPLNGGNPDNPLHWQKALYHRIITMCPYYWGSGETVEKALKQMWKAGAEKKAVTKVFLFYSDMPFAPPEREANEDECDAYVNDMGGMCKLRAQSIDITEHPLRFVGASIK